MHVITDKQCLNYSQKGHPERPQRIAATLEFLRAQKEIKIIWDKPTIAKESLIEKAHILEHIHLVENPIDAFDADTPNYPDIDAHARRSVGGALRALELARKNKPNFSLLRPPGHHATKKKAMGFCFFNSIAITALAARSAGVKKVAVFDFDVHHGNGTQEIFYNNSNVLYISTHQYPFYPGTGSSNEKGSSNNILNIPLDSGTGSDIYLNSFEYALKKLKNFKPEFILLSSGFDAHAKDPLAQINLKSKDFYEITKRILNIANDICDGKVVSILEGGYNLDALRESAFEHVRALIEN